MRRIGMALVWIGLVLGVSATTWTVALESWADRWGATAEEATSAAPGGSLIEDPVTVTTRVVTVNVPAEQVWPWVAQFGQGRGGLYSYDWLENTFGSGIHSTDRILNRFQDVAVGDRIWITQPGHPANLGHVVALVDLPHALVTAQSTPEEPAVPEDAPWTWAFIIEPADGDTSRLISRNRYAPNGTVADFVMDRIVGPVGFAMERRTVLGIAERATPLQGCRRRPPGASRCGFWRYSWPAPAWPGSS